MDLLIWTGVLIISVTVLVLASDYFVLGAEKIGLGFGMSPFLVGVFIVGIGTSLPELVSSIVSVYTNHSEIVIGNVLGSNITNIFLVLGVGAIVGSKFNLSYDLMRIDLPFLTGSSVLLALMIYDKHFSTGEAVICLVTLTAYFFTTAGGETDNKSKDENSNVRIVDYMIVLAATTMIFGGAKFTVDSVVKISEILDIGSEIIALSAVALGTSLPEVMVSISAARKGKGEMIVGNIIGSNIFNTFGVMGIAGITGKLVIPDSILIFSLPVSIAATFMYFIITQNQEVNRNEGNILIIFYGFYIFALFGIV